MKKYLLIFLMMFIPTIVYASPIYTYTYTCDVPGICSYELYEDNELITPGNTITLYSDTNHTERLTSTKGNTCSIPTVLFENDGNATLYGKIIQEDETEVNIELFNANMELPRPTNVKSSIVLTTQAPALKITFDAVANANGYLIKNNGNLVVDTKSTSYSINKLKYGVSYIYTVQAYRCLNEACTARIESSTVSTNTIKPTQQRQGVNVTANGRYDQNKLVISKPGSGTTSGVNTITYEIYRAKAGSSFTLIKTITNAPLTSAYTYIDTISGAQINATYNYKVVTKYDSSSVTLDTKSIKATVTVPTITSTYNPNNQNQTVVYTNRGAGIKYEVYRATSKKGKYTKIYDGANTQVTKKGTWNKTYYYKVRAYYTLNGKKTYTGYSSIVSRKLTMVAITKYPYTYNVNGTTDIIKSIAVTRKSAGSSSKNAKYSLKLTHTKTVSTKAQTVKYRIRFYNYDKKQYKDVWISVKLAKGTKKNPKTTVTVNIPYWATQYELMK